MSKESYARGFCKAAAAHGIDPVQLAKFASNAWVGNEQDERKGGLEGNVDAYSVPRDASGGTGWLGSTNKVSLTDGNMEVGLPGGAASLTNSPNAAIQRIVRHGNSATTNSIPVWKKGRPTLADVLYGNHPYYPAGPEIENLLRILASGKQAPAKAVAPAKK
jgi:hypothetical protein